MKTLNILVEGDFERTTIAYNVSEFINNNMLVIDESLNHYSDVTNIKLCILLLNIKNKYQDLPMYLENNYNGI